MDRIVRVLDLETFCRIVGPDGSSQPPLVCAHGGPGGAHDYLLQLESLVPDRQLVLYDQPGAGRSAGPAELDAYTIDLHVQHLFALARELGIDDFHLLGHSWGAMFGLEAALADSSPLRSLIMVGGYAATAPVQLELDRLRCALGEDLDDEEVTPAFMAQHFCRDAAFLQWMFTETPPLNFDIYSSMWGPSEFRCTGTLKGWDVRSRLPEIRIPVLVLGGQHDEITPAIHRGTHEALPNSRLHLFEHSSHLPFVEEPEEFARVLGAFLSEVDGA